MSQVAFGFLPDRAAMAEAVRLALSGAADGGFTALKPYEFEGFEWSGYVLVVIECWLDEQGVELPRCDPDEAPGFVSAWEPLLSVSGAEAADVLAELEAFSPSKEELAAFWEQFTEEATPNAAEFTAAGWDWLLRLLRAAAGREWCVVAVS